MFDAKLRSLEQIKITVSVSMDENMDLYLEWSNPDSDFTVCPRSSDPFYVVTYYLSYLSSI